MYELQNFYGEDRAGNLLGNLNKIELHHPAVTLIHIVGLDATEQLTEQLAISGFVPAKASWIEAISFRRLQIDWTGAPTFHLNATNWKTSDDVYNALFIALRAPSWHGRNFDALNDSIMAGQINKVEPPFRIVVEEVEHAASEARGFTEDLVHLIKDFADRGCPISISVAR